MTVARRIRNGDFIMAAGLLGSALVLGGGSAASPVPRMIVEWAGVITLGWFVVRGWRAASGRSIKFALALICALVAMVVVHTIPLPPGVWRALPGREAIAAILDTIGAPGTWLPLSVDPSATREAGYFLIPPIAMFIATLHLDRDAQLKLIALAVASALVSAIFVMIQAQGALWLTLYDVPSVTKGKGIFANKNHNAAFLVIAIPLVVTLGRHIDWFDRRRTQRAVTGVLIAVLAIAVVGCLSRAGLALLPFALFACIPLSGCWAMVRRHPVIAVAAMLLLVAAAILIAQSSIARETLERFDAAQEGRYVFWPDVLKAIHQFMPWGSGLGTFVPVFRMIESLQAVRETYTNHAHCDFMEIALEAGIPGVLLLLCFMVWLVVTAWARLRNAGTGFAPMLSSFVGIILLIAASIVDYPLRTLLLACVFAVLSAMLASPAPFADDVIETPDRRRRLHRASASLAP